MHGHGDGLYMYIYTLHLFLPSHDVQLCEAEEEQIQQEVKGLIVYCLHPRYLFSSSIIYFFQVIKLKTWLYEIYFIRDEKQ